MSDLTSGGPVDAALEPQLASPEIVERRTPAGLQPTRLLTRRRAIVAALNGVSMLLLSLGLIRIFGAGGWTPADVAIFVAFLIGAPWTVMGFWNAVIGLWLLHFRRDGLAAAAPFMEVATSDAPVRERVAMLMFLRNEDPERAFARLATTKRSLDATGAGGLYDVFVLSDTSDPAVADEEAAAFERWRETFGPNAVYRRREKNTGWKAGNIRDFLRRWGGDYTFFLPLDSDSVMSGEAVLRLQRVMEAHPRLGVLQSLVVGAPATSGFARVFQFGMRAGMRSFTMGAAWWHGDCGPYWGHNAMLRTAPFRSKCALPVLPGKGPLAGHILSHDQIEAALMRRAGYEVRVLPVEGESWEDNPPTLFEFTRRDLRWCQGNMQYWKLLGAKGLKPMSRFQIFAAIAMYFGAPAWMLMTSAAAFKLFEADYMDIDFAFAVSMFFIMFAVSLFPKIAGWLNVALTSGGVAAYGGRLRFAAGAVLETLFSIMLAPVVAFRVTLFLGGLLFGKTVTWAGQERDAHRVSWTAAVRGLWPQTLFGVALIAAILGGGAPQALPWAAPVLIGLCGAIPFAVLTSHPAFGRALSRLGLCSIPEDIVEAKTLARIGDAPTATPEPKLAA